MKPHLLPMHYRLGRELGLTPAEVKIFHAMLLKRAAAGPQPAVVAGVETLATISIITSLLATGFAIVASFFKPGTAGKPAELQPQQRTGRIISDIRRYAPRDGFDSLQDVATIGSVTPIIFALREQIDGVTYGGIRINMPMIWSQLQSDGNSQLIRAIFLASEGPLAANAIDPNGFALGSNTLNAYNLGSSSGNNEGARYSVYFSRDTGRIVSADRVTGRLAAQDPGNAENNGGQDVFAIRSVNNDWARDFSATSKPSTGGQFGVYSLIGNNLMYRSNPIIRPEVQAQLVPKGDDGDGRVKCEIDLVADAQREKDRAIFSTRSGITSFNVAGSNTTNGASLNINDTVTYILYKSSDGLTEFSKAFASGGWDAEIEVERIGGSGTTRFSQSSQTAAIGFSGRRPSALSTQSVLISGVKWLNSSDQVVSSPVITATPDSDPASKKVTLTTKVKYDSSVLTTDAQKQDLLYSRFKITFKYDTSGGSDLIKIKDEPSVYYRVDIDEQSTVDANVDFGASTFSYSSAKAYTINETIETLSATFNRNEIVGESASDVASVISGKQQQWDDAIVVGELYKVGSALAVCISRSPTDEVFQSEADFTPVTSSNGTTITAVFKIVEPGNAGTAISQSNLEKSATDTGQPGRKVATNWPHIFRCSISNISTTRPVKLIEIGIKSTLGITINGLCNFKDAISFSQADNKACYAYEDSIINKGSTLKPDIFTSGTISTSQQRYSFCKISYREAGSTGAYTQFSQCFGFRGIGQQSTFNAYSIEFPYETEWEVRHIPLTGWEIRNSIASGTLVVLDSRLSTTQSVTAPGANGAILRARGTTIGRSESNFELSAVVRNSGPNRELGLGYADTSGPTEDYVDGWGKLAEAFIYSEVTSTAEQNAEHEIAYINEIVQNTIVPIYSNLAICGLNIRPKGAFQQLGQFSGYFNAGYEMRRLRQSLTLGPSHLLPDVGLELCTNPVFGSGETVSDDQVNIPSFTNSANWCYARRYFYDSGFIGPQNVVQFIAELAPRHLLLFYEVNGMLMLKPAIPHADGDYNNWNVPVKIKGIFGAMQMRNFSFRMFEEEERRPIQISAKWRQERPSSSVNNPGVFPVEREILIRETSPNGSSSDPIEKIDMSDYATNERHVIDSCKYEIRFRRLSTHSATFETTQDALLSPIELGDYIQIPMDLAYYDEFKSGIIKDDGTLISSSDFSSGQYQAFTWNGKTNQEAVEQVITISSDGTASPPGIIFAIKETSKELRTYRVENVTPVDNGGFRVEVIDTPTDSNGRLLLSQNWGGLTSDTYWEILK